VTAARGSGPARTVRGLILFLFLVGLGGCATAPVNGPAESMPLAGSPAAVPGQSADAALSANAVISQGRDGYQRTTVPPGFLFLMLAVPLVILLL